MNVSGIATTKTQSTICLTCSRANSGSVCSLCESRYSICIDPGFGANKSQEYAYADQVEEIAQALISKFHKHLEDPNFPVQIKYVYVKKTPVARDKVVLGRARKITGLTAWLKDVGSDPNLLNTSPEPFFLMEVSWDTWIQLNAGQKIALVDHELEHFGVDQAGNLYLKAHDVEEFASIVKRHGLWKEEVKEFIKAAEEATNNPLFANLEEPAEEDELNGIESLD